MADWVLSGRRPIPKACRRPDPAAPIQWALLNKAALFPGLYSGATILRHMLSKIVFIRTFSARKIFMQQSLRGLTANYIYTYHSGAPGFYRPSKDLHN